MKYLSLLMTVCALLTMCILPAHAISPEEMEPFTVYDEEGNVIHSDAAAPEETSSLFLTKPFESYTVTEGFCLLFLLLGFCWCVWKIIKGGLFNLGKRRNPVQPLRLLAPETVGIDHRLLIHGLVSGLIG